MEKEPWSPGVHAVRTKPSQKFHQTHEKEPRRASSLRRASLLGQRRGTGVSERRDSQIKKGENVSGPVAEDLLRTRDEHGNEPSQPLESSNAADKKSDKQAEGIKEMKEWPWGPMEWEKKRSDSIATPLSSPSTACSPTKEQSLGTDKRRDKSSTVSRWPRPDSTGDQFQIKNRNSSEVKDSPDHDSELRSSQSRPTHKRFHIQGSTNAPNEGDNPQRRHEKLQKYADKDCPQEPESKDPKSDHNIKFQLPSSGDTLPDDDRIFRKGSGSWYPSSEQRSGLTLLPKPGKAEHNIDETGVHDDETVSDNGKEPDETKIPTETPSYQNKHKRADPQPQPGGSEPSLIGAIAIHDPIEEQFDPDTNKTKEAPDTRSLGTMGTESHDSQHMSHGIDPIKGSDSQSHSPSSDRGKSPDTTHISDDTPSSDSMETKFLDAQSQSPSGNDTEYLGLRPDSSSNDNMESHASQPESPSANQTRSPDSQSQSPDPKDVTIETSATQDHAEEDVDTEIWLNSDAPLAGNYKALFRGSPMPRLSSSDHSSDLGSNTDSLIVSPARTDEQGYPEEEDWNKFYRDNAEKMRIFDEYKANSQLQHPSEEQRAKHEREARAADRNNRNSQRRKSTLSSLSSLSSDGSLLLSPGQYDEKNRTKSVPLHSDIEEAIAEFENQAALNVIELYRANYQLKKDLEEKEAKFEREIKIAWKRPRPPPTTEEQRKDRVALEDMKSKEIFDEFGTQQRPIKTDPQLVLLETDVNIMIHDAQISHLVENYRRMYTRANQAVEAASKLDFPPLTARCCYYRGLASYLYRDFGNARDDFVKARNCADLYGISSESIERYIHLIDSAVDPLTAILEKIPPQKISRGSETSKNRPRDTNNQNESSPSTADDAETLVEDSPRSPVDAATALSLSSSPDQGERSPRQSPEDVGSQIQTLRRPSRIGRLSPDDDPQPNSDDMPTYQPQEETISEDIRKDIFDSKARSLSKASPEEGETSPPPTMASTEYTLFGSTASPSTTRRVPRPHVGPITTSFATARNSARETSPQASENMDRRDPDGMGSAEIEEVYASFGGRPRVRPQEDLTPDSASPRPSRR